MDNNQRKKGKSTDEDVIIGKRLKQMRCLRGWSQEQLAEFSGITFQQIQKYERGTNRISASRLLQFSKALNVDIQSFYGSLVDEDTSKDIMDLDPKILKIACALNDIEDKGLVKQIETIIKTISQDRP